MSTAQVVVTREHYLNVAFGWRSWLLTTDHKRVGLLFLISITFFFFLGGAFATLIRLELMTPQGDLFQAETYNKLFSMHGIVMIFFFLIPSVPAVLGNFLVPLMIGARDLAFPRLNLLSWYLYVIGGLFTLCAIVAGGVDTGWTFYTPYSSLFSNGQVVLTVVGIFIAGFSSILTGLNFIVTIHTMRAPGLTWFRLPLFIWSHYATAIIMVLGTPVIAITLALVGLERIWGVGIFDPRLGGDPHSLPAPLLVLFPSCGLHHDSSRHGGCERACHDTHAPAHIRLFVRGVIEHRYRRDWLHGLGSSHVRLRAVAVCKHDVFSAQHDGGNPFCD